MTYIQREELNVFLEIDCDLIVFHPSDDIVQKFGAYLTDLDCLKVKVAYCMYSTVVYDLKYFDIPVKLIR